MALNTYSEEYNFTANLGNKKFKFRPWTTKNEKEYLIAIESEETITEKLLFDILIRPCLEDKNVVLTNDEQKMLIIEIRKKSLGSTFPMKYACSHCNNVNDIDISFDKIVKFKESRYEDISIENMTFIFGDIQSENLKSRLDSSDSTSIEKSFIELILHIHAIEIDDRMEDTFSYEELFTFIESLPSYIFDELFSKFTNMKSSIEFSYISNCAICSKENNIVFIGFIII